MGAVVGALGQRGYGWAYRVLDAQYFGVPQRRNRVFIVCRLGDRAAPCEILLEPEGGERDLAPGQTTGSRVAGALAASAGSGGLGGVGQSASAVTSRVVETVGALTTPAQDGPHGPAGSRLSVQEAKQGHAIIEPLPLREHQTGSNGVGLGESGDPAYTLDTTGQAGVATTLQGGGRRGHRVDAEGAAGGHLIPVAADQVAGVLTPGARLGDDGQPGSHLIVGHTLTAKGDRAHGELDNFIAVDPDAEAFPVALRGREGGNTAEAGQPGDPAFTLRAADGGSSAAMVAATLTSGRSASDGVNPPGRRKEDDVNLVTHALTSEGADASEDGTGRGTPLIPFANTAGNSQLGMSLPGAPPVTGRHGANMVAGEGVVDGNWQGGSNQDQVIGEGGISPTLAGASNTHSGHHEPKVAAPGMAVRRLTPLECERLQGFPDGWTARTAAGPLSDAARYRMIGNAVALPAACWVINRTIEVDADG